MSGRPKDSRSRRRLSRISIRELHEASLTDACVQAEAIGRPASTAGPAQNRADARIGLALSPLELAFRYLRLKVSFSDLYIGRMR